MNGDLLKYLKQRRIALGFKQSDMMLRVGISRQQYQRLESKGNPRLDTLELLAKGLNSELMLIPQEKRSAVQAVLDGRAIEQTPEAYQVKDHEKARLSDDPWQDLLDDDL